MRVIKFRVWDSELKIWIGNIGMKQNNVLCDGTEKRFIVEQFTGLLDKNGKEVFEGDILHAIEAHENRTLEYDCIVSYDDLGFVITGTNGENESWLCLLNPPPKHGFCSPMTECEVIGNIHENPELL